ncbi:MAG: DgaE family pyridoxal phosphate-dependent ammonia lyase [Desulfitobacteriaceae bacterium]
MSIYQKYGLKTIINASGKMTALGASAVEAEVAEALAAAAMDYVDIEELWRATGRMIARVTGAEDGCPTSGAAAGIAISVAAVLAGTNLSLIEAFPHAACPRNQVILQKGHAVHFGAAISQMISLSGAEVVEVGQANHVERAHITTAINGKTAALFYVKSHHAVQKGMQPLESLIEIGRAHGIPVLVDAAAEEDLRRYIRLGADLVMYSGGKAVGGPTSGFICGRADLIEACRAQYQGIGRPMKVGKEGIIGLLTALERYELKKDDSQEQLRRMQWLLERLAGLPGVQGSIVQDEAGRAIFRAQLSIDREAAGIDARELIKRLEAGDPAIYTRNHYANLGIINIDPRPLLPGQEQIIAQRIIEIIRGGKSHETVD